MQLGMNMLLWTTCVVEKHYPIFRDLKEAGFDGAEIPMAPESEASFAHLRGVLGDAGLAATAVVSLDQASNSISKDPALRRSAVDALRAAIGRAHALGASVLCGPMHSAYKVFSGESPTEQERIWSAEALSAVADEAEAAGIVLAIEPLNRFECYLANTCADGREIVDLVDHPAVGMLYDTHHMHIEEKNVSGAIRASENYIEHVHVSENDRGMPGSGQVDFESTFYALQSIDYDGWLVIEAFSRTQPDFASAIHVWRDYEEDIANIYKDGGPFISREWIRTQG